MEEHIKVVDNTIKTFAEKRLFKMPQKFVEDVKKRISDLVAEKLDKNKNLTVQLYDKKAKQINMGMSSAQNLTF